MKRCAVAIGAAIGALAAALVAWRLFTAWRALVTWDDNLDRFLEVLRSDEFIADRYRLDPPLDLHDLQGPSR